MKQILICYVIKVCNLFQMRCNVLKSKKIYAYLCWLITFYTSQWLTIYETVVKSDRIWRYITRAKLIVISQNYWKHCFVTCLPLKLIYQLPNYFVSNISIKDTNKKKVKYISYKTIITNKWTQTHITFCTTDLNLDKVGYEKDDDDETKHQK